MSKDRLYIAAAGETRRRSCQTVLAKIAESLAAVIAPVLPHLAEDVWQNLPYATGHKSVFQVQLTLTIHMYVCIHVYICISVYIYIYLFIYLYL